MEQQIPKSQNLSSSSSVEGCVINTPGPFKSIGDVSVESRVDVALVWSTEGEVCFEHNFPRSQPEKDKKYDTYGLSMTPARAAMWYHTSEDRSSSHDHHTSEAHYL